VVRADAVRQMLGLADRTRVIDLFDHLARGDIAGAFREFREQYDTGADPIVVLSDLAEFVNFVTRVKIVPATADNVAFGETERLRARDFASNLDAGAVADVPDAAEGDHRDANRDCARRRRKWCWCASPMSPHADAGRSDQDARQE
jgi:DNA polymerase III gamma/tau subunit